MRVATVAALLVALSAAPAQAATIFDSGGPDGRMAMASRPGSSGKIEIEAADDFVLSSPTQLTGAAFTGLYVGTTPASTVRIDAEIYRIFPDDSTNPPSGDVPTRVNSPSDVDFAARSSSDNGLTFTTTTLNPSFMALNSVLNGINPSPSQTTGGDGPVTGQEATVRVAFAKAIQLPAGHYFFVPQAEVSTGEFYWLSSPKPITTSSAFTADLQAWIRNASLAPDWLRVGTDIVGGGAPPTFNASFSLDSACTALSVASPPR